MLPNGILVDVSDTAYEFFCAEGLGLVEAACPDILLALQTEGEPSFDELHGLFQGNIGSGCDERVEVVGHDHVCVQEEFALAAVVEDGALKQCGVGGDLEETSALCGDGGDEVRAGFLRS